MPDADQQENDQRRQSRRKDLGRMQPRRRRLRFCRADAPPHPEERFRRRQRVEHVVPHPRAQGDVPPAPVLADGPGEIRSPEVFGQLYAQDLRDAAGDVDPSGEIGVDLQRIQDRRHEDRRAVVIRVGGGHRPDHDDGPVGDHQLFEISPRRQLQSAPSSVIIEGAGFKQLRRELRVISDRPLYDLREKDTNSAVFPGFRSAGYFPR